MRPAKVTAEHIKEAEHLLKLWEAKPDKPSQMAFGHDFGIGSQGAVWRFLHGKDPLSIKAAAGFARGLGCMVSDFSPRLAREIADYALVAGAQMDLTKLSRHELQLVQLFRGLDLTERRALLTEAERRYAKAHPPAEKPVDSKEGSILDRAEAPAKKRAQPKH